MHILRQLEKNDYNKHYLQLLETLTVVNANEITYSMFENFVDSLNPNHNVYVIEHNNKIIGSCTLLIENKLIHKCGKVAHIEDLVVDSEYKGQGIGKFIVTSMKDIAHHNNCYKIILDCDDSLIKFYTKCEFMKKGSQMSLYF